jgi:hypothetical protein
MSRHQPALLGGLFIGVLSALPVVNAANLCCCLWVVAGGLLTVYLQQQNTPEPVETAEAVLGGLLAGLIGAVISATAGWILMSATGAVWQDQLRQALENPEVPAEMRDMLERLVVGRGFVLLAFAINIPIYAIFSMLGALLGLAIFKKKTPPQPQG